MSFRHEPKLSGPAERSHAGEGLTQTKESISMVQAARTLPRTPSANRKRGRMAPSWRLNTAESQKRAEILCEAIELPKLAAECIKDPVWFVKNYDLSGCLDWLMSGT
jgi:hypothetical protein